MSRLRAFHNVVSAALVFRGELDGLRRGFPHQNTFVLERRLVESARALDVAFSEWAAAAPAGNWALPRHEKRALKAVNDLFRRSIERWGWGHYLGPDGENHIAAAMERHEREKRIPWLQAQLSRRSREDLPPDKSADEAADEAERLGLKPTMGPGEAEKDAPTLWDQWRHDPALGERLPKITEEERLGFDDAVEDLREYAQRLSEQTNCSPTALPSEQEASTDAPKQPPRPSAGKSGRSNDEVSVTLGPSPRVILEGEPYSVDLRQAEAVGFIFRHRPAPVTYKTIVEQCPSLEHQDSSKVGRDILDKLPEPIRKRIVRKPGKGCTWID
jgi:hypothetical protein